MKCTVCDLQHQDFERKCRECKVPLSKKRQNQTRSKQSKGKDKYKKKKPDCNGNKIIYSSNKKALSTARVMFEKGISLRIYKCNTCQGYHLTKLRQKG
tara:strand:- start:419 stop:712 length:294 start_codon:yes stop_codon:yes gene_type:complete